MGMYALYLRLQVLTANKSSGRLDASVVNKSSTFRRLFLPPLSGNKVIIKTDQVSERQCVCSELTCFVTLKDFTTQAYKQLLNTNIQFSLYVRDKTVTSTGTNSQCKTPNLVPRFYAISITKIYNNLTNIKGNKVFNKIHTFLRSTK